MTEHRFFHLLLYVLIVSAGIFLLFRFLLPVLLPFLLGLALAALAEPVIRMLHARCRLPRGAAAAITVTLLLLLLGCALTLLLRVGSVELGRLSARLPALLTAMKEPLSALR